MRNVGRMPEELREIIYLAPEQRSILGSYINADARWHFLPNPAAAGPGERIRVEDNKLFLFIGRMSPEKGAEVAAMAARLAGVAIAFCGDGRSKDIVRRVNPDAQLRGWLPKEELGHWMGKARALVFPSLWYEGYPLVVADALRAGLPVIVSDSCMAASSITDGVDGLHVPAGNVVAWADAMTRFKSDNFARALGSGAFSTGATLLGYDDYISRLLSIYGQALERHREKRNGWRLAR